MKIALENIGKRYGREWIFRHLSLSITKGEPLALVGNNGSGKSTLLKTILAFHLPTEGLLRYQMGEKDLTSEALFAHLAWAAPYMEVVEDFTLHELWHFHSQFKKMSLNKSEMAATLGFASSVWKKEIRHFSSGMKQKVRLAFALFSDTAILALDEPTSNLDSLNARWYRTHIESQIAQKVVIVASNLEQEYEFCTQKIDIHELKSRFYEKN
ncbi:ABC transporter ATP-binding protein [Hugenholtzia roseola]|uniref:ABC transporter ATP-binding protein n=1 Tax=Hugenholtzia roseola TaxID=1002 RepID=UPI00040E5850|nr:ATP-binding cassette domain-containing protein [Hugenholtzia roseola]